MWFTGHPPRQVVAPSWYRPKPERKVDHSPMDIPIQRALFPVKPAPPKDVHEDDERDDEIDFDKDEPPREQEKTPQHKLTPETHDPGPALDAGTHTYTHTPGSKTVCQRGHLTYTQVTYTYTQSARNVAGQHVHPLTPAPNHTQIPIPSPIQYTMAAERAVGAVSEPSYLTGKPSTNFIDAPWVCTLASTPGADTSSAIVSAGKGQQETRLEE